MRTHVALYCCACILQLQGATVAAMDTVSAMSSAPTLIHEVMCETISLHEPAVDMSLWLHPLMALVLFLFLYMVPRGRERGGGAA